MLLLAVDLAPAEAGWRIPNSLYPQARAWGYHLPPATRAGASPIRDPGLLGGLDELHVEGDGNLFAHQEAAGLESRVPRQAVVLAVDFCGGRKSDAGISPRVLAGGAGAVNSK